MNKMMDMHQGFPIVERSEKARPLFGAQFKAWLVRLLPLNLLQWQLFDYVEFDGISQKERGDVHIIVHSRTRIPLGFEPLL